MRPTAAAVPHTVRGQRTGPDDMPVDPHSHLLKELVFPARYEALVSKVGDDVARLVVAPSGKTLETLEELAHAIRLGGEGPLRADVGSVRHR